MAEGSELTEVPRVREITVASAGISPDTLVRDVVGIFRRDETLLALPIIDGEEFLGIISRKVLFFRHLGRPFSMELFGKKPIRFLLEERPLALDADLDVNSALERLLAADPALEIDSFPVMEGARCLGIASVALLMMSIARTQADLLKTLNALTARIREEVDKASRIQQDLLPLQTARFGDIVISAEMITSTEIGGDFYDYVPLADGTVCIVMGDVSGHGVQAGMVTTAAKASLHTLIAAGVTTPSALLSGMNNAVLATARQRLLMTCIAINIDQQRRIATMANAGHTFPYRFRHSSGALELIEEASGFPLGFEHDAFYPEWSTPFDTGDRLFVYTDGIIEAADWTGSDFGYDRFEAFLREHLEAPPGLLRRQLLAAIHRFTAVSTLDDDVTLLVASFNNRTQEES
ncbi:PP2C family protein-serine/threonine phosphatase [Geobacter pickeringii]|uniref:Stage II sporulation protein E n=1 Tax=Geobacter pickeringii TaxID=345632 RepID=A0A0B5BF26_9BACT|nr:SpoIIE family protein phosphatase [Geobacter pickeringii]AJE03135.1 stage II sporulation protein E [Geobacter pickeringii]